jgi:hypothetical protein
MAISPYVAEFDVDREDINAFLDDPKPLQPVPRAATGQAESFWNCEGREGVAAAGVAASREGGGEQTSARFAGNPAKWTI